MKTNLFIALILIACTFSACKDEKAEEKAQLTEVLKVHDEVMGKSEAAVKNKMVIDSLIKQPNADTTKLARLTVLDKQLNTASEEMENWMHTFNPDYTGKSHAEVMEYLHSQRLQLLKVDSLMKVAISQSTDYLKTK